MNEIEIKNHGTLYAYAKGCRCGKCAERKSQANKSHSEKVRRAKHESGIPTDVHGSLAGYITWRCRCKLCKEAKGYSISRQSHKLYVLISDFWTVAATTLAKDLNSHPDLVLESLDKALKLYRKNRKVKK